jgi:vitamin B12 transporter
LQLIPSIKLATDSRSLVPVPKLGLLWEPLPGLSIRNNYFRAFKFPDFEDLYWQSAGYYGNPDLRSEDGFGGDLGLGLTRRFAGTGIRSVSFDATLFGQYIQDSIHWSGMNGTWRPENIDGGAAMFGLDTKASVVVPLGWGPVKELEAEASYQLLLSYLLCYGYTWDDAMRVPYQPMHTIGASLRFKWGSDLRDSGSVALSGHYEGLRFADTANRNRLAPYFLLNLTVNQQFGPHWAVYMAANNILNWSYESMKDYPMPGASITIGARVKKL